MLQNNIEDIKEFLTGFNRNSQFLITSNSLAKNETSWSFYTFDPVDTYKLLRDNFIYFERIFKKKTEQLNKELSKLGDILADLNKSDPDSSIEKVSKIMLTSLIKTLIKRKDWTKRDLFYYVFDKYDLIKTENKFAFEFLTYMIFLDGFYISSNLLKKIYEIIRHPFQPYPDSTYDIDLEFEMNDQLNYLVSMSIIRKASENRFVFHDFFQNELIVKLFLSHKSKSKIINTTMQALNNLLEDSNININDEIEIFFKQVNKLINIEHEGISNNS